MMISPNSRRHSRGKTAAWALSILGCLLVAAPALSQQASGAEVKNARDALDTAKADALAAQKRADDAVIAERVAAEAAKDAWEDCQAAHDKLVKARGTGAEQQAQRDYQSALKSARDADREWHDAIARKAQAVGAVEEAMTNRQAAAKRLCEVSPPGQERTRADEELRQADRAAELAEKDRQHAAWEHQAHNALRETDSVLDPTDGTIAGPRPVRVPKYPDGVGDTVNAPARGMYTKVIHSLGGADTSDSERALAKRWMRMFDRWKGKYLELKMRRELIEKETDPRKKAYLQAKADKLAKEMDGLLDEMKKIEGPFTQAQAHKQAIARKDPDDVSRTLACLDKQIADAERKCGGLKNKRHVGMKKVIKEMALLRADGTGSKVDAERAKKMEELNKLRSASGEEKSLWEKIKRLKTLKKKLLTNPRGFWL